MKDYAEPIRFAGSRRRAATSAPLILTPQMRSDARPVSRAPDRPGVTIEVKPNEPLQRKDQPALPATGGGGGDGGARFHKRSGPEDFGESLRKGKAAVRRNMFFVMLLTCATHILILAIPIYLFQISDRVLTSRSVDTLVMLTLVIVGAVVFQAIFDAIRRFMLMRTAIRSTTRTTDWIDWLGRSSPRVPAYRTIPHSSSMNMMGWIA